MTKISGTKRLSKCALIFSKVNYAKKVCNEHYRNLHLLLIYGLLLPPLDCMLKIYMEDLQQVNLNRFYKMGIPVMIS